MPSQPCDMGNVQLLRTLAESFIALSDEVQVLIDRKTILEHKLRYAHEQYQCLADKYAPAVPEVAEILAQIQLPPDLSPHPVAATSAVPLPRRTQTGNNQHQIALLIREGRKAAQELIAGMTNSTMNASKEGRSNSLGMEGATSVSTVLEKDFTVEGKKGALACPFSAKPDQNGGIHSGAGWVDRSQDPAGTADPTPHKSSDPICAAMLDDKTNPTLSPPSKCPIRFLDKHSPEEIAHYVETHKHAIPRSHEICVRRYQRNEEQIKKLDAKYGNLVNMVKDLSQLHRPLMPPSQDEVKEAEKSSNKRVEDWAQTVAPGKPEPEDGPEPPVDEEREARFDRPLRDVRVGESPSRPWGISVPLEAGLQQHEPSPKAPGAVTQADKEPSGPPKCPFDHTKMFMGPVGREGTPAEQPFSTAKLDAPPPSTPQPTFVNLPEAPAANRDKTDGPQVVFNISGPVFIGYPMEQAIEFMKQFQGR
ncbi:hypothetical protein VTH82DRAFT_3029 [Thermothelomyces myriococcoides]